MDPTSSYRNDLHNGTIDNGSMIFAMTELYHPSVTQNDGMPTVVNYSDNQTSVYRFFDKTSGTKFLTTDVAERNSIIQGRTDLAYEGVGMEAVKDPSDDPNAAPVFRFFDLGNGTHFFTTDAKEAAGLAAARPDLKEEAASVYEHTRMQEGNQAVYRFFDTKDGSHFYTNSAGENAQLIQTRRDMVSERVAFYAPRV